MSLGANFNDRIWKAELNHYRLKPVVVQFISMKSYIQYSISDKKKIDKDISILYREYEDKKEILQNLANFRNNKRSLWLNFAMLFVSTVTLFFVVFPRRAEALVEVIRDIYNWILQWLP